MQLTINGKEALVPDGLTLAELVVTQGFNPQIIVVERNKTIVNKDEWQSVMLEPEDCLEVVSFVGGG